MRPLCERNARSVKPQFTRIGMQRHAHSTFAQSEKKREGNVYGTLDR